MRYVASTVTKTTNSNSFHFKVGTTVIDFRISCGTGKDNLEFYVSFFAVLSGDG